MKSLFVKLFRIPPGTPVNQVLNLLNMHLIDPVKAKGGFNDPKFDKALQNDGSSIILITWEPLTEDVWGTFAFEKGSAKSPLDLIDDEVTENIVKPGMVKQLYSGYDFAAAA